jgi:putative membrane protein (TIGR04086 family)
MIERLLNILKNKESILDIKVLWLGFTISLGVWFITVVLVLIWLVFMGEGNYWLSAYIYILGIAGVVVGSIMAGIRATRRGWLHGLWVGALLGLMGAIVNLELMPYIYTWTGIGRQLLTWSLWGLFGGHLGHYLKGSFGREKVIEKYRSH